MFLTLFTSGIQALIFATLATAFVACRKGPCSYSGF